MSNATAVIPERLEQFQRRKRLVDLTLVLLTSVITVPLLIIVSVVTWKQQGRPVFFRQERLGYLDHAFYILKFRTMSNNLDDKGNLLPDAQRLTSIGRLLRITSLDELPQLINIARGEMSFIGPRPLFPRYLPYYTPRERKRHLVRPGITGLAQVRGRNYVGWDDRFELDVQYVEKASHKLDLEIVFQTIKRLIARSDISVVASASGLPLDIARAYPSDGELRMRRLEHRDLETRVRWMNDVPTREFMRLNDEITYASTVQWYENSRLQSGRHDFVVENSDSGDLVAFTGLRERMPRQAESYIMVKPGLRGQGVGFRSQRFLLEWAFRSGSYDIIISSVRRDNMASHRMHSKFGGEVVAGEEGRDEVFVYKDSFQNSFSERD